MSASLSGTEEFETDLHGEDYKVVLERLHRLLKPATYLEIGSRDGSSLALSTCASVAIDPEFSLIPAFFGAKPFCCLYRMGSDAFFRQFAAETILGGKVDFAFLDGLHLAEFLLRDFINTERACRANSVIAIHDCFPLDVPMARRHENGPAVLRSARYPGYWTGDVWKFMAALRVHRPALQVHVVAAQPTGLVLVTGLDPHSTVLQDNYYSIVNGFRAATDADLVAFSRSVALMSTTELMTYEDVSRYFWL